MTAGEYRPEGYIATVRQWAEWRNVIRVSNPDDGPVARDLLYIRTAVGDGSVEEQLIRLMVWVGASLVHKPVHSGKFLPLDILCSREGWCDQQSALFGFLAYHMLGVSCRLVSVKHTDPPLGGAREGHTMAEAHYWGKFHLFDVHNDHQAIYRDHDGHIMSVLELREHPEVVARCDHWWIAANGDRKDGFYRSDVQPKYSELDYAGTFKWPWDSRP